MTRALKTLMVPVAAVLVLACVLGPALAAPAKGRWLKIRVYDHDSQTPTVLVNLPMGLVSAFLRMAGKTHVEVDASNDETGHLRFDAAEMSDVIRELETMAPGQVIEVQDHDQKVTVWIE